MRYTPALLILAGPPSRSVSLSRRVVTFLRDWLSTVALEVSASLERHPSGVVAEGQRMLPARAEDGSGYCLVRERPAAGHEGQAWSVCRCPAWTLCLYAPRARGRGETRLGAVAGRSIHAPAERSNLDLSRFVAGGGRGGCLMKLLESPGIRLFLVINPCSG